MTTVSDKSLFVVFEGIDGSGKTTLINNVISLLSQERINSVSLREPTSGPNGKKIRSLLCMAEEPDATILLDLFMADRLEDASLNIIPALKSGNIVLLDRYYYSTAAYQSKNFSEAKDIIIRNRSLNLPEPDILFFLDIDPDIAYNRVASREKNNNLECFETPTKLRLIDSIYREIIPENTVTIDAALSPDETAKQVYMHIKDYIVP